MTPTSGTRGPAVPGHALKPAPAKIALSTVSVYPESPAAAFEIASRLGYDGVEVMVMTDSVTQDPKELRQLSETYGVPILAVHAPCLLITQRVWGSDPWGKLVRARQAAVGRGETCEFMETNYTYDDAVALGSFWQVPVSDAKARIGKMTINGKQKQLSAALKSAKSGKKAGKKGGKR